MIAVLDENGSIYHSNQNKYQSYRKQDNISKIFLQVSSKRKSYQVAESQESVSNGQSCGSVFLCSNIHYEALGCECKHNGSSREILQALKEKELNLSMK